ncbi:hypothetical protein ELR99_20945 [Salmonella enterica subsp. enterica serovar Newport]|nr:hypothetical protein [Salmonella enterica subsp. enterica serovar Newport]
MHKKANLLFTYKRYPQEIITQMFPVNYIQEFYAVKMQLHDLLHQKQPPNTEQTNTKWQKCKIKN